MSLPATCLSKQEDTLNVRENLICGESPGGNRMRVITFTLPILPGQQEAWRRCLQEMLDVYRTDYEVLRHRLGVTRMVLWLTETPHGTTVIVQIEADELETLLPN